MHLIRCTDETYGGSKIGSAMCTNVSLPSSRAYSSDRSLTSVHRPAKAGEVLGGQYAK